MGLAGASYALRNSVRETSRDMNQIQDMHFFIRCHLGGV